MAPENARHWAEALEPRLLHSADLSPLLAGAAALPLAEQHGLLDDTAQDTARNEQRTVSEIVFIDATLPDAGTLLADLQAQQAAGRALEVVLLHDHEDGLAVIGKSLEGRSGLSAIHLISHGGDGRLQLGATTLDAQTVLQRAGDLAAWQGALAADADLLIYGCDVAASDAGRHLLADLAALTGADVAASDDTTGAAAAGGDWVLEAQTGRIESALAPSIAAQQAYAGTLPVHLEKAASARSSGDVTSLSWEHDVNDKANRLLVVQLVVGTQTGSTSVTYGGQALTLLAQQESLLALGTLRTEVWYLLNPTQGKADVVVSSTASTRLVGGSLDFKDVDQDSPFGPIARSGGSGSNISLTVAAAVDDIVIDVVGSKAVESGNFGSNQNKTWEQKQGEGGSDLWGSASREPGAGSVTMSQTLSHDEGSSRWSAIAVAVKYNGNNAAPVITSDGGGPTAAVTAAENGTAVTTVTASDAENGALSYSIVGGTDAALFTIDASTGVLRFATAPNAEAPTDAGADNVYDVTVQVSDGLLTDSQALAVTVSDVNEFALGAIGDSDAAAEQVLENAAIGSSVGITASASDADRSNNAVGYSLTDNAGGRFGIDAATGVVRVAATLDRETAASHTITVRATSSDGSSQTRSFTIAVADSDEFDTSVVTDIDAAADAVNETAGVGTRVGITARASDADATQNAITYSLDDNAGGRFSIGATSGVIRVAGALDFEAAASHGVVARATSADGSSSTASFSIAINDVSEAGVGTITDSDAAADGVAENLAPGAATGVRAQASDPDAGDTVSYSLLDSAGGRFTIDSATGIVRSAVALDAEAASGWDIVVRAASTDGSSTQQTFTIAVADVDEFDVQAPLDSDAAADAVDENAAIGSAVGIQVTATDADADNHTVSYSLSDNAGGRFAIDAASGRVSVAAALDREAAASHTLTVVATSADGSSAQTSFTIAINDVNEFFVAAIDDSDADADAVDENAVAGTRVGITASAVDVDATHQTIAYSLLDDAGGRFAIDAASGIVRVAGSLDFESATSHRISVRATSADGSSTSSDFTIAVNAVNDHTPVFVTGPAFAVTENATAVGTVQASDADLPTPDLFFSISGGADAALFSIDPSSGELRFRTAPDFERPLAADGNNHYQVQVAASDGSRSATQALVITVTDSNEAPVLASHAGAANVAIGTVEGSTGVISAVVAADPEGRAIGYRISGGADSALFTIDAATGVLRWGAAPDYEAPLDSDADNVYDVTVAASDGTHDTLQSFSIGVANRNEAPQAGQPLADRAAVEDTSFTLALPGAAFSDVDAGDTLTYSAGLASGAALPSWLAFDPTTRSFSGTPANADVGSLTLRVKVVDGAGASTSQDFVLTVVDSNDAPLAGPALPAAQATEGERFEFVLPAGAVADPDSGDRLQFDARLTTGQPLPGWLSFDADNQIFSGTPSSGDSGTLVVRITATDASGATASTDLQITVIALAVPPAPAAELPVPTAPSAPEPPAAAVVAEAEPETAPSAEGEPEQAAPADTPAAPTEPLPELLAPPMVVADNAAPGVSTAATPAAAPQRGGGSAADSVLAPAVLPQFTMLGTTGATLGGWLQNSELQRSYEALQQQLQQAAEQRRAAMASGVAISGGLSIGYVVWLVRGGVLMSSMLSTLPAWKMLDPLPVLAAASSFGPPGGRKDADADDVERLFDEGSAAPTPAPQQRPAPTAQNKTPEEIER